MDGGQSSAYADAVVRARQIAAKLGTGETGAPKRPAESGFGEPEEKRPALDDQVASQLTTIPEQPSTNGSQAVSAFPSMLTEEYTMPDDVVGLVIGKGGEQIIRLQSESGCKIQIATAGTGDPKVRSSTLTGTPDSIQKCRQLLDQIVERGNQNKTSTDSHQLASGATVVELLVPGQKTGLVIGKGGETIKRLQEENRVKMVVIQDSNQPTEADKPLRITGSEADVNAAKEQVLALLASKSMERPGGMPGAGGYGDYGASNQKQTIEIPVPGDLVAYVIGKQGDMINKIQAQSEARVQFRKENLPNSSTRMCMLSGSPQAIHVAQDMINTIVRNAIEKGRSSLPPGSEPPQMDGLYGAEDFTQYPVPNGKCGFVIGKGGEVIRQIAQNSGAQVEISRDPPPNPMEKLFNIKGTPDQIRHAIRLICDRAGLPPPPGPPGPGGPPPGPPGWGAPGPQGYGATPAWGPPYDANTPGAGYAGTPDPSWAAYAQQQAAAPGAAYAQPAAQPDPAAQQQPQATIDPVTGQADYTQAWAEYFRNRGMADYANIILQQQAQGKAAAAPTAAAPAAAPAQPAAAAAPAAAPAGYQYPGLPAQQPAATPAALPYAQPAAAPAAGYGQAYPQQPTAYGQPAYSAQ